MTTIYQKDDNNQTFDSVFQLITVGNISKTSTDPRTRETTTTESSPPESITSSVSSPKHSTEQSTRRTTVHEGDASTQNPVLDSSSDAHAEHFGDPSYGTFVGSADVISISKKQSEEDAEIGPEPITKKDQIYSVGSVLHFESADDEKIIEDGGILTSAASPDFDPYDVLADLFVREENPDKTNSDKHSVKENMSWSIEMKSKPETGVPFIPSMITRVYPKPTRSPSTILTSRNTASNIAKKTTVKYTRKHNARPTTTTTTTTTKATTTTETPTTTHHIDIESSNVVGHFNDPWGLLKLSGMCILTLICIY